MSAEQGRALGHQVVRQEHGEGLVADVVAGHADGVAEAPGLVLAHEVDVGHLADAHGPRRGPRPCRSARASPRARASGRSGPRRSSWTGPVTMRMSSIPAATASSTTYWIPGLSTRGSISFGVALVAGRKRVPSPAAGITALRTRMGRRTHAMAPDPGARSFRARRPRGAGTEHTSAGRDTTLGEARRERGGPAGEGLALALSGRECQRRHRRRLARRPAAAP